MYHVRVRCSKPHDAYELGVSVSAPSESDAKRNAISEAKVKKPGYDSYTVIRIN
jgi:hypothetical protein